MADFTPLLDIARHMHRLHVLNTPDAAILAPAQEGTSGLRVGRAGVLVANVDGEELRNRQEARSPALLTSVGRP